MEQDTEFLKKWMGEQKVAIAPLVAYLPYLEAIKEKSASSLYQGDGIGETSVPVPVYDSNLLGFIREAEKSGLMDRNYPYVYSRNGLKTHADELRFIEKASWREWDALKGIIANYVLGGRTRAYLWSEGAQSGVLAAAVEKMKEICEFWNRSESN